MANGNGTQQPVAPKQGTSWGWWIFGTIAVVGGGYYAHQRFKEHEEERERELRKLRLLIEDASYSGRSAGRRGRGRR